MKYGSETNSCQSSAPEIDGLLLLSRTGSAQQFSPVPLVGAPAGSIWKTARDFCSEWKGKPDSCSWDHSPIRCVFPIFSSSA